MACSHLIHHPETDEERAQVIEALDYARSIGDLRAIPLLIAQLSQACQPAPVEESADTTPEAAS